MPLRLRLVIAREGDVLTIRFGPRRSTSLSAGISVWLALLFLLSAEATSVLWAGGFGVLIWSYFGILLLLMWTFGLRILFWNLRFTTRIVISPRIIMVYKGICRQRKTLECELTPLMWFWLGIPAPPGFRADYEFLGLGTWYLEMCGPNDRVILLRRINRDEAHQIATAIGATGLPIEGMVNELLS